MIKLTEEYVTKNAEELAKSIHREMDPNQLRKFYDDFKVLERKMNEQQNPTDEWFKKAMLPLIKFAGTKIVYSAGRKKSQGGSEKKALVPENFKNHILGEIDKIERIDDFKSFLMHYQAIIAFFTYQRKVEEDQQKNQRSDSKVASGYNTKQKGR